MFLIICAVLWSLYVDYSSSAHGRYMSNVAGIIAQGNNENCIYTSAPSHIADCSEFICRIYIDIVVPYLHMNKFVCITYVAYMWYLRGILAFGVTSSNLYYQWYYH